MDNAIVQGSEGRALAIFIEDSRGDLVDIEYLCYDCAGDEWINVLPWPGYEWPDYPAHCHKCRDLINRR